MVCRSRFFFALFALCRFSISLGLLERPLVIGLCWGLVFGNLTSCLYIAIFYELLWLDFIPVGTFIPPHMTAAAFTGLALATYFGLDAPPLVFLALIFGLPMAWLGAKLDRNLRDRLNRSYSSILHWVRRPSGDDIPAKLIARTLFGKLLLSWLFFVVGAGVLAVLLRFVLNQYSGFFFDLDLKWSHFLIAASLGGLLSLRLRSLYLSVGVGAVVLGFFRLAGIF
ncbi:MAG: PTS sugar transporter subunit IIC [Humidesulfovibrio sp.]|uniref:PTS sugar transporter subunit IIC n=1 Tax=Humidesulfovibrio sp. TaxID=2910988 RepID=UPI0027F7420C|nr:PTS sugar transporter subunit IIC [Humidesulfovibrio sp.]MDQ7834506.1 PTS sugar transporter subunit IIC [Humidesulfovibrio sp.]